MVPLLAVCHHFFYFFVIFSSTFLSYFLSLRNTSLCCIYQSFFFFSLFHQFGSFLFFSHNEHKSIDARNRARFRWLTAFPWLWSNGGGLKWLILFQRRNLLKIIQRCMIRRRSWLKPLRNFYMYFFSSDKTASIF